MAKGAKITTTDMQMRILNGFDRELRNARIPTSGLLRNAPVHEWLSTTPGITKSTPSHRDKAITRLKEAIQALERRGL